MAGATMPTGLQLEVRRSGRQFEAEAVITLAADAVTVWSTITDYAALPRFMPGIRACRVLTRQPVGGDADSERLQVEQRGEFRFLLFAQAMTVLLDIHHQGRRVAEAKALSVELGLFKRRAIDVFEGRYEIRPLPGRRGGAPQLQLVYNALIGLRLPPPPAIGSAAVRQNLAAQLEALVAEVARRQRSKPA